MPKFSTLILACSISALALLPAFADEMAPMKDGMMMMMNTDGKIMQVAPQGDNMKMLSDAMMQNGHEMDGPMFMMMSGGKMMIMMDDMKMDDGKMVTDHMMMK